jgi:cobalamin-dependent methionine synthase I
VFEPTLARLRDEATANGWLKPQAVYGYFPYNQTATT